jgi:quercetin dioxygenase-like cupin family protein
MKAATHMEQHRAEARISIQVLVGKIRLHLPELAPVELSAEQLLALDCGMRHDVEALQESAFLLTVSLTKGTEKP